MPLCKCGCGQEVQPRREYIYHHHRRGFAPWNKGLTNETDNRVALISQKVRVFLTGRPRPVEVTEKQRASVMGKNKGRVLGKDFREMRRRIMLGTHQSDEEKEKRSQTMKSKIASGEWFPTIPSYPYPKPNKTEVKLLNLLDKYFPDQYKYTGDGSVIIAGLNPDFTNCNGRKEVIEMFGDYWHKGEDPQEKIDRYAKFGFRCLVIWEKEIKSGVDVISKIQSFREV